MVSYYVESSLEVLAEIAWEVVFLKFTRLKSKFCNLLVCIWTFHGNRMAFIVCLGETQTYPTADGMQSSFLLLLLLLSPLCHFLSYCIYYLFEGLQKRVPNYFLVTIVYGGGQRFIFFDR